MRASITAILFIAILNIQCKKDESEGRLSNNKRYYDLDSLYNDLLFDKDRLEQIIMTNRDFFETYTENLSYDYSDTSEKKFQHQLYRVIGYKECDDFEHWWIYKNRYVKNFDLEPYKGIYFIITDRNGIGVSNLKISEDSFTMDIVSSRDSTVSYISGDSIVTTRKYMNYCSDVVTDKGMMCWDKVITTKSEILCDRTAQLKSDTVINVKVR